MSAEQRSFGHASSVNTLRRQAAALRAALVVCRAENRLQDSGGHAQGPAHHNTTVTGLPQPQKATVPTADSAKNRCDIGVGAGDTL